MKYLLTILMLTFLSCKKETPIVPEQPKQNIQTPDSIKYVMSDTHGCRITWRDETGMPHIEQVQNLKSFNKKLPAVSGKQYFIQCENSALSFCYIYLNDSLVASSSSTQFTMGCYSQWSY